MGQALFRNLYPACLNPVLDMLHVSESTQFYDLALLTHSMRVLAAVLDSSVAARMNASALQRPIAHVIQVIKMLEGQPSSYAQEGLALACLCVSGPQLCWWCRSRLHLDTAHRPRA